jgi:CRISPR-associated protein Cmr2
MTQHLFIFQIGPVQAFIAQARRTADLLVGSRTLSELAKTGVTAIKGLPGFQPIFPFVDSGGNLPKGVPHKFSFVLETKDPAEIAETVKTAIDEKWKTAFVNPVREELKKAWGENGKWAAIFDRQSANWMEFYWVAISYDAAKHGECFQAANVAMAQRKLARYFPAINEPGDKCTLTGTQSALVQLDRVSREKEWDKLRNVIEDQSEIVIDENENLGSLALIKRLSAKLSYKNEKFHSTSHIAADDPTWKDTDRSGRPKEVTGYLAVLHMDGDQMGKRLGELTTLKLHQEFSRHLAQFAGREAVNVFDSRDLTGKTGQLVYAGGDDVLALLPLKFVLQCARELQNTFYQKTGCTASAGIAITPHNLPLDVALDLARKAEHTAKETYGRNAVVVMQAHGSGQIQEAGGKWAIVGFIEKVQKHFQEGDLSGKLGYDLLGIAHDMFGDELKGARRAEIQRLAKRRTKEGASDDLKKEIKKLVDEMCDLVDGNSQNKDKESQKIVVPTWEAMAHWLILARFMAQDQKSLMKGERA